MKIRRAVESDLSAIMSIVDRVVPIMRTSGNPQWSEEYPNLDIFRSDIKEQTLFVGEIDSNIAGVVVYNEDQPEEYFNDIEGWDRETKALVIHRMAVNPDQHRKGVARQFYKYAEVYGKENGYKVIRADTNSRNIPVNFLFMKMEYQYKGVVYFRGITVPFNCYQLLLD